MSTEVVDSAPEEMGEDALKAPDSASARLAWAEGWLRPGFDDDFAFVLPSAPVGSTSGSDLSEERDCCVE